MPMRNSTSFHQPCGQKRAGADPTATESVICRLLPADLSGHEPALRGWCAGIHFPAAVEVVVDHRNLTVAHDISPGGPEGEAAGIARHDAPHYRRDRLQPAIFERKFAAERDLDGHAGRLQEFP